MTLDFKFINRTAIALAVAIGLGGNALATQPSSTMPAGSPGLGNMIQDVAQEIDRVFSETRVQSKDTSNKVFERLGIRDQAFKNYVHRIRHKVNPLAKLKPGSLVQANLASDGKVLSVRIFERAASLEKEVAYFEVARQASSNKFEHSKKTASFQTRPAATTGIIKGTLDAAVKEARIPAAVQSQIKDRLSHFMDLRKDARAGDRFTAVYEMRTIDGSDFGAGRLLALEYQSGEKVYESFWFEKDGISGYFDGNGESVENDFLRMPCESRVTSSFNRMRRHPVTGRLRPHWGIDLGAPRGTPVYAAADGEIKVRRYQRRGYGYWLEIQHAGGYTTLYAHLSKYAKDARPGKKVKKGQLIGYVGSTGMTTGPHLHYELKRNGQQVNPLTVNLSTSASVASSDMEAFHGVVDPLRRQLTMAGRVQVALNRVEPSKP